MKRDSRLGAEHWTGCYNFENIICDGHAEQIFGTRQGGLKMGGTYWYYVCDPTRFNAGTLLSTRQYQVDGDIDFHNAAEPSTTSCPMLPGQVVNVLNVPIYCSSGQRERRNASVSSTSSDLRTMNPEDRYLNPRPAPKPALALLKTLARQQSAPNLRNSPSNLPPAPGPLSHRRNASPPSSAVPSRSFRLPRKASMDARGRSTSPMHVTTSLLAAFRQLAPIKATNPETSVGRWRAGLSISHRDHLSDQAPRSDRAVADNLDMPTSSASSRTSSEGRSPTPTVQQDFRQAQGKNLALRHSIENLHNVEAGFAVPSFQNHRRQRSRSREPSPLRKSSILSVQPKAACEMRDAGCQQYQPLQTLNEIVSARHTPVWPSFKPIVRTDKLDGAHHISQPSGKRLATSPNTPSSVYSPIEHSGTPPGSITESVEGPKSSFSKVTVSDEFPSSSDRSPFSHWTGAPTSSFSSSQWSSIFFEGKPPSFQATSSSSQATSPWEITSPGQRFEFTKRERSSVLKTDRMPSVVSSSTASSYDITSPCSPLSETSESTRTLNDQPPSLQKRYGMLVSGYRGYRLPIDAQNSESTSKCGSSHFADDPPQNPCSGHLNAAVEQSPQVTNMQHFIKELSYLGGMIQ